MASIEINADLGEGEFATLVEQIRALDNVVVQHESRLRHGCVTSNRTARQALERQGIVVRAAGQ